MRVLGLDVGTKTIGVAVTDELGLCAHAVETLPRRGNRPDAARVAELCRRFGTQQVVVGLPYDCAGQEGKRAERVRVFGGVLAAAGLRVEYHDESYSTVEAESVLLSADLSRAGRRKVVDRLAAAVILQSWLDATAPKAAPQSEDERLS